MLGRDVRPRPGSAGRIHEARLSLEPVDFAERLVADGAVLADVPLRDDGAHQAIGRRALDLCQALAAARLLLGPTRAVGEREVLAYCRLRGVNVHGGRRLRLWAFHDPRASQREVAAAKPRGREDDGNDDWQ